MKKRIFKRSAYAIILVLLFCFVSELLHLSEISSVASITGFYKEPKNSIDVVCIGASEVYTGYSPTIAWKKFGYTSYDLSIAGAPGNIYKSMLKEVVKRQNPKVVVFEINGFVHDDSYFSREGKLHTWIDEIPWSKNRIQTIQEIIPQEKQMGYYLPIMTYHTNWKHPKGCFYRFIMKSAINLFQKSNLKGFASLSQKKKQSGEADENEMVIFTEQSREYLTDLLEYCKSIGLENVLFVRFPHGVKSIGAECFDEIDTLVTSYGYTFLNAEEKTKIGINYKKDFYNEGHLNLYGAKKMTKWFGKYLTKHYDLNKEYSASVTRRWDKAAQVSDNVMKKCKADIKNGIVRHYTEASAYIQLPEVKRHHRKHNVEENGEDIFEENEDIFASEDGEMNKE